MCLDAADKKFHGQKITKNQCSTDKNIKQFDPLLDHN